MSATEAQIERAVTVLKRMIDAAENGDQARRPAFRYMVPIAWVRIR